MDAPWGSRDTESVTIQPVRGGYQDFHYLTFLCQIQIF